MSLDYTEAVEEQRSWSALLLLTLVVLSIKYYVEKVKMTDFEMIINAFYKERKESYFIYFTHIMKVNPSPCNDWRKPIPNC